MRGSHQTYESFVGKISPFLLFEMEFHSLFYVVQKCANDKFYSEINPASQVASIGLIAYFEAFCKHQFAAIVNLIPSLITSFCAKRGEPKIEFSTVVSFGGEFDKNLGFALAESYDFGTAKAINNIFRDLLLITPFNKEEITKFSLILQKRNLLVHHAGYYTLQSLKKSTLLNKEIGQKAFKDAVRIDTHDYEEISDFLFEMAMKITRSSVNAVKNHPDFRSMASDIETVKAVNELLQGIYDTLDEKIYYSQILG